MVSRVNLFILGLTLWLFLSGCQKGPQPNHYREDGRLELLFWHGLGGGLGQTLNAMIDEYNQSQDDYYVKTEFMGRYDILEQKVIASVMAGKTPDMAQMYEGVTMLLTRDEGEESLLDMREHLQDWEGFEDLFEVFQRNSTYEDGAVYSLPFNKSFPVLFSNMQALRLIGREKAPQNWTELKAAAREIREKVVLDPDTSRLRLRRDGESEEKVPPMQGFAFPVDPWVFEIMLLQQGGRLANAAETEVRVRGEEGVQALDFWLRALVQDWGYRTEGYSHQNDFGAQKVAFIITSVVSRIFMEDKLSFEFDMTSVPATKEGTPASIVSGTNICVFNDLTPERTAGAIDFVKWFASREQTAQWARETFYLPLRKSALNVSEFAEWSESTIGAKAAIDQLPYGQTEPRTSAWYRCRIMLREAIEKILSQTSATDDLNEARAFARKELDRAAKRMNRELQKYAEIE